MKNSMESNSFPAVRQLGILHSVIRLHSWPELSRIAPDLTLDIARVCALLAVRPTGTPLISKLLNMPRERVAQIVQILHAQGHLDGSHSFQRNNIENPQAHEIASTENQPNSLLSRLWQRLFYEKA